ncbi:6801_t:CDS:1, partial [Acaulospora morrowiae]
DTATMRYGYNLQSIGIKKQSDEKGRSDIINSLSQIISGHIIITDESHDDKTGQATTSE